jgi:hypothetical protein
MIAHHTSPDARADIAHDVVLVVKNVHAAECGPAPRVEDGPDAKVLTLYFRSDMADQLVLQYDPKKKIGILRSGDIGWDNKFEIRDDVLNTAGAIFGNGELTMVAAAWEMWTGGKLQLPPYYKLAAKLRAANES